MGLQTPTELNTDDDAADAGVGSRLAGLLTPPRIAAVVTLLAIAAAVTFGVLQWAGGDSGASDQAQAPVVAGDEEAAAVADALARLADDPASLVAADSRSAVGDRAAKALPADAAVAPEEETWQPDGLGGGVMTVTVTAPGSAPVTYAAIMVKEEDGWKVAATVPMNPAAPAPASVQQPAPQQQQQQLQQRQQQQQLQQRQQQQRQQPAGRRGANR